MGTLDLEQYEIRPSYLTAEEIRDARKFIARRSPDHAAELLEILNLPAVFVDHGTRGTWELGCRCCVCEDRVARLGLIGGAE